MYKLITSHGWTIIHSVGIHDIISPSSDEFHEKWTWVCLNIVDEICEPPAWHLIGFLLIPKCICSHHTHANEQNIGVDD